MEVIIDRFEGEYAVVELDVGEFVLVPRVLFGDAKEGDVVDIRVNKDKRREREEYIQNLMNNLFED